MSNGAHRRQRRRRGSGRSQRQPAGPVRSYRASGTLDGVPVYEGHVITPIKHPAVGERVMFGIGPIEGTPVAYLALCPTAGVRDLVDQLRDVAAPLAERHDCDGHT